MRTPLIAGNWKMYKTVGEGVELVEALLKGVEVGYVDDRQVLICPPFTALYPLAPLLADSPIALGAQNMYPADQGAFTGEVSPVMLQDIGCQFVILGHSERRQIVGEDDALISQKVTSAMEHGLTPVLCVGETKPQRDAGEAETVTLGQLRAGLGGLAAEQVRDVVIAYEPVWAIGTGVTATPGDAQAMHAAIRGALASHYGQSTADAVRILYGGSVKPDNIDVLMAQPDIDGALVGGASLQAESFLRIVNFQ
ncbi:MAG: triose-phosphate isomerase [Chloroflexota bacterium]|nr:triose-phosphate isomerase [Chloroflexota bacterium]